jgi:hypothetical protein
MSLPGGWRDEAGHKKTSPLPSKIVQNQIIQSSQQSTSTPAVTQFCNEYLKELDDLQNVEQLLTSFNEQREVIAMQVMTL